MSLELDDHLTSATENVDDFGIDHEFHEELHTFRG